MPNYKALAQQFADILQPMVHDYYRKEYPKLGASEEYMEMHGKVKVKPGKKWIKIDVGTSGFAMLNTETGDLVHIKSKYGVPDPRKNFGNIEAIIRNKNKWWWDGFSVAPKGKRTQYGYGGRLDESQFRAGDKVKIGGKGKEYTVVTISGKPGKEDHILGGLKDKKFKEKQLVMTKPMPPKKGKTKELWMDDLREVIRGLVKELLSEANGHDVELFWKGLKGKDAKIGRFVVSPKTYDNIDTLFSNHVSVDLYDDKVSGKQTEFKDVVNAMKNTKYGKMSMKKIGIHEGPTYKIGAGGLEPLSGEEIQIVPGGTYHLGASSSPDHIIVTKVDDRFITYRKYPYEKDLRIEKNIGADLIKTGIQNWLKSGYQTYQPKTAKIYKQVLAGGKPKIEKLSDYKFYDVTIQGEPGVDVYGAAKEWGLVGGYNDKDNTAVSTIMKKYIPELKKMKGIKILKIGKGSK